MSFIQREHGLVLCRPQWHTSLPQWPLHHLLFLSCGCLCVSRKAVMERIHSKYWRIPVSRSLCYYTTHCLPPAHSTTIPSVFLHPPPHPHPIPLFASLCFSFCWQEHSQTLLSRNGRDWPDTAACLVSSCFPSTVTFCFEEMTRNHRLTPRECVLAG